MIRNKLIFWAMLVVVFPTRVYIVVLIVFRNESDRSLSDPFLILNSYVFVTMMVVSRSLYSILQILFLETMVVGFF